MPKFNNTFIESAEDLDIVKLIHNLLEYSNNYSMTSETLWNYYRDEVSDDAYKIVVNGRLSRQQQVNLLSIRLKKLRKKQLIVEVLLH